MKSKSGGKLQVKLGQRIAELRSDKKLTQEQLADKAGLDRMTIALVETGRRWPQSATVSLIAKGLSVKVGDLFTGL